LRDPRREQRPVREGLARLRNSRLEPAVDAGHYRRILRLRVEVAGLAEEGARHRQPARRGSDLVQPVDRALMSLE